MKAYATGLMFAVLAGCSSASGGDPALSVPMDSGAEDAAHVAETTTPTADAAPDAAPVVDTGTTLEAAGEAAADASPAEAEASDPLPSGVRCQLRTTDGTTGKIYEGCKGTSTSYRIDWFGNDGATGVCNSSSSVGWCKPSYSVKNKDGSTTFYDSICRVISVAGTLIGAGTCI